MTKAEYSFSSDASSMNFVNCEIGELISWNATTVLTNCNVPCNNNTITGMTPSGTAAIGKIEAGKIVTQ